MLIRCLVATLILQKSIAFAFECPAHLWDTAEAISEQRLKYFTSLRKIYNVKESDPGSTQFNQFPIDPENVEPIKNADIILEYKQQLREQLNSNRTCFERDSPLDYSCVLDKYTECVPEKVRCFSANVSCNGCDSWRSYSGRCNNLRHWKWGAKNMQYNYMFEPCFDDGINSLRRCWKTNEELTSPRIIGNRLAHFCKKHSCEHSDRQDIKISMFAAMFGQIIAHDCSNHAPVQLEGESVDESKNGISCCSSSFDKPLAMQQQNPQCIPIAVPVDDKIYGKHNIGCLNFIRAQHCLANDCKLGRPSIMNLETGYLDLSIVYGQSVENVNTMRSFCGGLFNLSYGGVLPEGPNGISTGDNRATQSTYLAIWHAILYKLHNYFAIGLAKCNEHWDDQRVFEEARRLLLAYYEKTIYNEWLPVFLGHDYCHRNNLTCDQKSSHCGHYDPNLDASINNEFVTATLRKFHTYLNSNVNLYSENGTKYNSMRLSVTMFNPALILPNYLAVLRGMLYDPIASKSIVFTEELRSYFARNKCGIGIDLFTMDLMRGRDVGVVPYIKCFEKCVAIRIRCWRDLKPFIEEAYLPLLQKIYLNVDDIDLMIGILAEKKIYGEYGVIGACIFAEQFRGLKFGNRFFYTFKHGPNPFTEVQIAEINRISLSEALCWVTKLKEVAMRSMEIPNKHSNPMRECSSICAFNFDVFKCKT